MRIEHQATAIKMIGIDMRTDNARAFEDIPAHWKRIFDGNLLATIPKRLGDDVLAVYTRFAHPGVDNQGEYSFVIGAPVSEFGDVPAGLMAVTIGAGRRAVFTVSTGHPELVGQAWRDIWQRADLDKSFLCDFECYRPNGDIEIHVGLRE